MMKNCDEEEIFLLNVPTSPPLPFVLPSPSRCEIFDSWLPPPPTVSNLVGRTTVMLCHIFCGGLLVVDTNSLSTSFSINESQEMVDKLSARTV